MKTTFLAAIMFMTTSIGWAQQPFTLSHKGDVIQWKASIAAVAAASALTANSSMREYHLKPMNLLDRSTTYDLDQVRNQAITFGAIVGVEYLVVHKWPASVKVLKWVNFGYAGVGVGRSIHAYQYRAPGIDPSKSAINTQLNPFRAR